jgi:hypothetical protein
MLLIEVFSAAKFIQGAAVLLLKLICEKHFQGRA